MKPFLILWPLFFCMNMIQTQLDKKPTRSYQFIFQNKAGSSVLSADSTYQNQFNEAFTVRSFKYYISHLRLTYNNGKTYSLQTSPRLINEADSASKQFSFSAPAGNIVSVQFLIGIDSITNTTGVQTGDLDPAKGMFWIWNTGYIMAKLEGSSSSSKAPAKQYSYDIGGYKDGESATREISLSLPPAISYRPSSFIITADINKWFCSKNNIRIAEQPMCHSPGALAMKIADNYAGMFSLSVQ